MTFNCPLGWVLCTKGAVTGWTFRVDVSGLVGEVGELAELIQWKTDAEVVDYLKTSEGSARMSEELADVFIYLLRLAEKSGLDLAQITYRKLSINEEKYPVSSSRGNATKYNERQ